MHAISGDAKAFCVKLGLVQSPTDPMTLLATVSELMAAQAQSDPVPIGRSRPHTCLRVPKTGRRRTTGCSRLSNGIDEPEAASHDINRSTVRDRVAGGDQSSTSLGGRVIVKLLPTPAVLSTRSVPFIASTR